MNRNPGKGGPLIIVDGTPKSGVTTLSEALFTDVGVPLNYRARWPERADNFVALSGEICGADQGPLLIPRLLLTTACLMHEAEAREDENRLIPEQWSVLDDMIARRNGRVICLVDLPSSIEARIPEAERGAWPRERLARRLASVNQAFACSAVARKGSYILPQFIDPMTGEKTSQYWRLVGVLKGEIEAVRCGREGDEHVG